MNKIMQLCFIFITLFFSWTVSSSDRINLNSTELPPITFYTENFAPANYVENNKLMGISVDSIKLIWSDLGLEEQNINVVPWTRGYRNVLKTPNSALFTMSKTPAREHLFKWVGPISHSVHVLMAKKSAKLKFDNLGDVLNYKVSTIQGDISEISLQQIGFPEFNMAKVKDLERAFVMMKSGRVDMMMASVHSFQYLVKRLQEDVTRYEPVWSVNKVANYIAFNKQTPDSVIKAYQTALNNVEVKQNKIKKKYNLPESEY